MPGITIDVGAQDRASGARAHCLRTHPLQGITPLPAWLTNPKTWLSDPETVTNRDGS
jgi:hypothetical protein